MQTKVAFRGGPPGAWHDGREPSQEFLQRGPGLSGLWHLPGTVSLCPQVSTAEVADAASYMCVAENPAGSVEKLFTLRVQGELRGAGNPDNPWRLCSRAGADAQGSLPVQTDTAPRPAPRATSSGPPVS